MVLIVLTIFRSEEIVIKHSCNTFNEISIFYANNISIGKHPTQYTYLIIYYYYSKPRMYNLWD
jgi:hypothetical protein